ncbi:MAG: hypothetical protein FJ267_07675, partial [Planctomycetes bacterium]|nr:hypothetical protein [Planctomycetota bacterium]
MDSHQPPSILWTLMKADNSETKEQETDTMNELFVNIQALLIASWDVLISVLALVLPWTPFFGWIAFWLFAVNWTKLRDVLFR